MTPLFFQNQKEFRKWLEKHHKTESELLVGYYKVDSGKPSMSWSQSVDEALCFGWIDGIRRSMDRERYCIRFTPRKKTSVWSTINIRKVEELTKQGLMKKPGLDAFNNRKTTNTGIYSFENKPAKLDEDFENIFRGDKDAWEFFNKQAPSYQKTTFYWIMSAKQDKTRMARLQKVIEESAKQKRVF